MLTIVETHPVQYHAPVYRCLAQDLGVPLSVIYGSDFSVAGYRDEEFDADFAWDTDLLTGYKSVFLSKVAGGGPQTYDAVRPEGLEKALEKFRPTAQLSIGYRHPYDRAGIRCAKKNGWPLLFRSETTDHALARGRLKSLVRDTVLRRLYSRCSALLYIGQRSRAHYARLGVPDEKLIFSPYCVDTSTFSLEDKDRGLLRDETRRELGIGPGQHVILYSGKLSYRKGVDLLVEAVKQFPEEARNTTTILFLGDGEKRSQVENLSKAGPAVDARLLGFQNQSRLSRFYHAADLLTLPSRYSETWGLVVNEGLLHGLPCVVSEAVGCHPNLIQPGVTGEVFPSDEVAEFSAALQRSLAYAKSDVTRGACRALVEDYSIRNAARGIAAAYDRVTGRDSTKP